MMTVVIFRLYSPPLKQDIAYLYKDKGKLSNFKQNNMEFSLLHNSLYFRKIMSKISSSI